MRARVIRILPGVLLAMGIAALTFYLASGLTRGPAAGFGPVGLAELFFIFSFGSFLPLGAFIATRRPDNPIGWIMSVLGLAVLLGDAAIEYALRGLAVDPGSLPAADEVAWLSGIVSIPGIGFLSFLMLLFPTGHLVSPRWRWIARLAALDLFVLFVGSVALWPARGLQLITNDVPPPGHFPVVILEVAWIFMVVCGVAGLISLVVRFRRSTGVERQQLKSMAFVAGVVATLVCVDIFVFDSLGLDQAWFAVATEMTLNLAVAGIPATAALAILRYRLYDIDLIINRTLVYGALTAILAGIYLGLVFGFQAILAPVTAESDLAIAASTLAVAGLFRPIRSRVQGFIDHRFYRRKFDAQRTLEAFSSHLRDEVDLAALSSRLTAVVADTMQPSHVSLWIRGPSQPDPVTISER